MSKSGQFFKLPQQAFQRSLQAQIMYFQLGQKFQFHAQKTETL